MRTSISFLVIAVGLIVFPAFSVAEGQTIRVSPATTTTDAPISVRATSLEPSERVTIRATMLDHDGGRWEAAAMFTADARGAIDLSADAPTEGSYSGVNATGLLTSMSRLRDSAALARFESRWSDTLVTVLNLEVGGTVVASDTLRRTYGPSGVVAVPVRDGGLVGTLFHRTDGTPQPGILVVGGSEGGNSSEDVAFQLAGHGFTTLSVAYFGAEGLPPSIDEIPLEYFANALDYLERQPTVMRRRLAMLGTSKGAEAGLLVAARSPKVRAFVAYAPSSVAWSCICDSVSHSSWTWRGESVPAIRPGADPSYRRSQSPLEPALNYSYRLRADANAAARIPGDRIEIPVLLIAGDDDRLWPSAAMARDLFRSLSPTSKSRGSSILIYHGAGHLIPKSILPAGSTLLARGRIQTGGTPAANAAAGIDAWTRTVDFLTRHLAPR